MCLLAVVSLAVAGWFGGCAGGTGAEGVSAPVAKIDMSKDGVEQSGLWQYEHKVSNPGSKSEGYHGKLLYNGQVLPEPASANEYYQTPWGPMYWVGNPAILWGTHGWIPVSQVRTGSNELTVPTTGGKLIVYAEVLAPGALATPDRLEEVAWVVADLEKFGVKQGHVQRSWFRLNKEPETIQDTKRWGTAQLRLADTAPAQPLAVEVIGSGVLQLTPEGASADASLPPVRPKAAQRVELPRQIGATRLVKYTMQGLPFDEKLELYLAFRVESLGRILVVGPDANGKTVTVKDVDTIMIRLPGEDPNQAVWAVTSVKGKAVQALGPVQFEGDTANAFGIALSGTFNAYFRVQQKGQATVALEYRPVSQENKPAAKSFKVDLSVLSTAKPQR